MKGGEFTADIKKLIEIILSDKKLSSERSHGAYRDEPIIKTAAQMDNYMPPKYREMRRIAKSDDAIINSVAWLFYTQGKLMEDFEDDFDYHGDFVRYFPTYQSMSDLQLRGYFSWRTKVRRGNIEPTSLSFAFVYIYELLNLIGVASPQEGFDALHAFWSAYGAIDTRVNHYIKLWLSDFVVYYNLDPSLLGEFCEAAFEGALAIAAEPAAYSGEEVFSALCTLSSYNIENSRFYKEYPDDVAAVACAVFRSYGEYWSKNRKSSLGEKLFGRVIKGQYIMFRSAVFYDRMKYQSFRYVINDIHKYSCRNGIWECEKHFGNSGKSTELGAILKAVDCRMREKYGFSFPLKPGKATKTLLGIIDREIDEYLAEKQRTAAPIIEIDVSKLSGIRSAALETQSKLIIDIGEQDETDEPQSPAENNTVLDGAEYRLMQLLLFGGDYVAYAREKGIMLSVMIDSINEKLLDDFGDTVIVFNGDSPEVLEDYAEELKGIIRL